MTTPATTRIVHAMPFADYRAAEGYSKTGLATFEDCPALFKAEQDGLIRREETAAMSFGTLFHAMLLEFKADFYVKPDGMSFATKDGKQWRDSHNDKAVIKESEANEISAMSKAARSHLHVAPLLAEGRPEVSMFGIHKRTGLLLKGRADWALLQQDGPCRIVDIKTTSDASDRGCINFIAKYKAFIQASLYLNLAQQNGFNCQDFYFVFIQRGQFPLINVWHMSQDDIEQGNIYLDAILERLARCIASNVWPDYSGDSPRPLIRSLPEWVFLSRAGADIGTIDLEDDQPEPTATETVTMP